MHQLAAIEKYKPNGLALPDLDSIGRKAHVIRHFDFNGPRDLPRLTRDAPWLLLGNSAVRRVSRRISLRVRHRRECHDSQEGSAAEKSGQGFHRSMIRASPEYLSLAWPVFPIPVPDLRAVSPEEATGIVRVRLNVARSLPIDRTARRLSGAAVSAASATPALIRRQTKEFE
jgi:hypothetical protein